MKDRIRLLFKIKNHIQAKIFVSFALLTMVAMLIVVSLWYSYNLSNIRNLAVANVTDLIVQSNDSWDAILADVDKANLIISTNETNILSVISAPAAPPSYEWFIGYKSVTSLLDSIFSYISSRVAGVAVLDLYGKTYVSGSVYLADNILSSDWISRVRDAEGKQLLLMRRHIYYYDGAGQGDQLITFGRAIIRSGKCIGYIITDIRQDAIRQSFAFKSLPGSQVLVIDPDGYILYHSDDIHQNQLISETEYAGLYADSDRLAAGGTELVNHVSSLVISYQSKASRLTTLAIIPNPVLFQNERAIRASTLTTLVLILLAVLAASMLLSKQITKNLKILNNNIRQVSEGRLDQLEPVRSQDEVEQLSRGFETMVGKLKTMLDDIREKERQKRSLEIKVLQAQISPHFLYNTLNTINYLAQLQNADNIREVSSALIDLLRISLWNEEVYISFSEELKYVDSYLSIQKYKYLPDITVQYDLDEELLSGQTIKMILQPIVENALIHGIDPTQNAGQILIRLAKSDHGVVLSVTDNGQGMTAEQIQEIFLEEHNENRLRFSGIGLGNVNERIRLRFGQQYGVRIFSQIGFYTTVELHLPLIRESDQASL